MIASTFNAAVAKHFVVGIAISLLLWGCNTSNNEIEEQQTDNAALTYFNPQADFTIINKVFSIDYPSSAPDSICNGWNMEHASLVKAISKATPIDMAHWHHDFDHLPCGINGKLRQANTILDYAINAGAWFTISNADTTCYFGIYDSTALHYFLSEPWVED